MSQIKNRIFVPPGAVVERPFLICFDLILANEEGQGVGNMSGDTIGRYFRITSETILAIKQQIVQATPMPDPSLRPLAVVIRYIMELEE